MTSIEPETYDVIFIGSGLVESLLASALAKSGKQVLIVDPHDTYGSDYASFQLSHLQQTFEEQQMQRTSHQEAATQRNELEKSVSFCPLARFCLPIQHVKIFKMEERDIGNMKDYIFDLAPKFVLQNEPLVDLLVRSRAHFYLDFKAVDGWYVQHGGELRSVPSSKGHIFRDKALSLGEKRSLMKLLASAMEGAAGNGAELDESLNELPLQEVLAKKGIPAALRDVVLYGIAMVYSSASPAVSKAPTEPYSARANEHTSASHDESDKVTATNHNEEGFPSAASVPNQDKAQASALELEGGSSRPCKAGDSSITASNLATPAESSSNATACDRECTWEEGLASLRQFVASVGKYGGSTAFLASTYGSGAVVEAFVRSAAVHGAVTVLREPLKGLACEVGPDGRHVAVGVLSSSSQLLRASTFVSCTNLLRGISPEAEASAQSTSRCISRAIVISDASLVDGVQTLGWASPPGQIDGVPYLVRGIQLGPACHVAAKSRYVCYLSCASASDSAHTDLHKAVEAFFDVSGLKEVHAQSAHAEHSTSSHRATTTCASEEMVSKEEGGKNPAEISEAEVGTTAAASKADLKSEGAGSEARAEIPESATLLQPGVDQPSAGAVPSSEAASAKTESTGANKLASALHVYYYQQLLFSPLAHALLPENVLCCGSSDGSLASYSGVVGAAEALFKTHFAGLSWLAEISGNDDKDDNEEEEIVDDLASMINALSSKEKPDEAPC